MYVHMLKPWKLGMNVQNFIIFFLFCFHSKFTTPWSAVFTKGFSLILDINFLLLLIWRIHQQTHLFVFACMCMWSCILFNLKMRLMKIDACRCRFTSIILINTTHNIRTGRLFWASKCNHFINCWRFVNLNLCNLYFVALSGILSLFCVCNSSNDNK